MARLARYVGFLGLLSVAWCRIGYDLRPTQTSFATDHFDFEWGWTPMPTAAPRVLGGLQRRQNQQYAPNATCGFVGGIADYPFTCFDSSQYCGFNSGYEAAGCCDGWTLVNEIYTLTGCDFFTTCYDSTAVAAECDSSCLANTHVIACTEAGYPYCLTNSFTDARSGYTFLGCDVSSGLTDYLAITINAPTGGSTTTSSSPPAVIIPSSTTTASPSTTLSTTQSTTLSTTASTSTVVVTTPSTTSVSGTSTPSITTPSSTSTSVSPASSALGPIQSTTSVTSSTSSTSATTVGPAIVTTTIISDGVPVGTTVTTIAAPTSSGSGSSSPQNTTKTSSSSNTGAIAGGVVGGLAVLALAAFLIWFCLHRRNRRTADPAGRPIPEVSQHTTSMQSPYSGGPVSPITQGPSQYGSPEQVHEFPAAAAAGGAAAGMYGRSHPTDHPQSGYQPPGQYQNQYGRGQGQTAHEVSSEGTGSNSGRPLNPNTTPPYPNYNNTHNTGSGYENAPEVVQQQQGGYRGLDPTGGGYNHMNANASYGGDPGFYGRPYSEMP